MHGYPDFLDISLSPWGGGNVRLLIITFVCTFSALRYQLLTLNWATSYANVSMSVTQRTEQHGDQLQIDFSAQ